jgi:hypothetical protein
VHRDNCMGVLKKLVCGKRSLFRTHGEYAADRQYDVLRLVKLINKFHITENPRVTCVVNAQIRSREPDYPTGGAATENQFVFLEPAARTVVGICHCNFDPSEVQRPPFVHHQKLTCMHAFMSK